MDTVDSSGVPGVLSSWRRLKAELGRRQWLGPLGAGLTGNPQLVIFQHGL